MAQVRSVIGYEVPLAVDHFGHIALEDGIKLAQRVEKFNLAWLEDLVPWQYTDQYVRLAQASNTPICTGEDIYLKENFRPLLEARGVSVIHPDILSSGGILENKKIGDMAQDHGVAMAVHMAESPIACMAAVHSVAATENFLALENHSVDIPWWSDLVNGLPKPLVQNGFIDVPDKPGLGIESLNEELIAEKVDPMSPGVWEPTEEWDDELPTTGSGAKEVNTKTQAHKEEKVPTWPRPMAECNLCCCNRGIPCSHNERGIPQLQAVAEWLSPLNCLLLHLCIGLLVHLKRRVPFAPTPSAARTGKGCDNIPNSLRCARSDRHSASDR